MFKRKLIKELRNVINELEDELHSEKAKNHCLEKDVVLLLNNARKDREKIRDLENNIELLVNSSKCRKLKEIKKGGK